MRQKILLLVIVIVVTLVLSLGWFALRIHQFSKTPLITASQNPLSQRTHTAAPTIIFTVHSGVSIMKLANELKARGIIQNPTYFILLAKMKGSDKRLQTGEYSVTPGITPQQLLDKIVKGEIFLHKFTIIEGWTFKQVMQALNNDNALKHTLKNKTPKEIMAALGMPNQKPEGLFYPDTYMFGLDTKDVVILQMAYQHMKQKLDHAFQTRAINLPYKKPYDALIVASMIEKESRLASERPLIARVILNRLQKNMLLQIDASVIYGLGSHFTGAITKEDLHEPTPYNTYVNKGLPPTPIAMPGISSINAALHPAMNDALYYVAKGDGSHIFSRTLKQHDQAIKEYWVPTKQKMLSEYLAHHPLSVSPKLMRKFWFTLQSGSSLTLCNLG